MLASLEAQKQREKEIEELIEAAKHYASRWDDEHYRAEVMYAFLRGYVFARNKEK